MLIEQEESGRKRRVNFFAKEGEIVEAIEANEQALLLVFKGAFATTNDTLSTNELFFSLPQATAAIIKEFEDIFPNETPRGLPPLR